MINALKITLASFLGAASLRVGSLGRTIIYAVNPTAELQPLQVNAQGELLTSSSGSPSGSASTRYPADYAAGSTRGTTVSASQHQSLLDLLSALYPGLDLNTLSRVIVAVKGDGRYVYDGGGQWTNDVRAEMPLRDDRIYEFSAGEKTAVFKGFGGSIDLAITPFARL